MNTEDNFDAFLKWEAGSRDTIDFKKIYVDITVRADTHAQRKEPQGDLIAGLMLSQIIYWYLPNKNGKSKLRVIKDGQHWIAKQFGDWWDEIRISKVQARRGLQILSKLGLVETDYFRFNGLRTMHIRLIEPVFMDLWQQALKKYEARSLGNLTTGSEETSRPEVRKPHDP